MYNKKKERLYICDLLDNPAVAYPSYYVLSSSIHSNEMLQTALIALHNFDFSYYDKAKSYEDIFAIFHLGSFSTIIEKEDVIKMRVEKDSAKPQGLSELEFRIGNLPQSLLHQLYRQFSNPLSYCNYHYIILYSL